MTHDIQGTTHHLEGESAPVVIPGASTIQSTFAHRRMHSSYDDGLTIPSNYHMRRPENRTEGVSIVTEQSASTYPSSFLLLSKCPWPDTCNAASCVGHLCFTCSFPYVFLTTHASDGPPDLSNITYPSGNIAIDPPRVRLPARVWQEFIVKLISRHSDILFCDRLFKFRAHLPSCNDRTSTQGLLSMGSMPRLL
jgi:hypothetical protein